MSRSYNEISNPWRRGRKLVKKIKRLSSKKIRQIPINEEFDDEKIRKKKIIDKDSLIQDYKKKIRY